MAEWAPKRFWKETAVAAEGAGFTVHLDGRPVRTPAKAALILPTRALAEAVAAEWQAQEGKIDPGTMPATRTANSAIDKLARQQAEVVEMLAAYGETDLLCYRAERPLALAARQAGVWNPLLAWAEAEFGAALNVTAGVLPVEQPAESLARLRAGVAGLDPFRLAAFHDLVAISGSLVLALAVVRGRIAPDEAWEASRIDETWQNEQWGIDEEAARAESVKRRAFTDAWRFFTLCG